MNTIRNYLDNMFRNLPNTEEVRRAKTELLEMMEDKYEELIKEGKTENEAVGIVISEFGNLDELAESLGISEEVTENLDESKPMLSMDRVKDYLTMISQRSILVPLAIALCISCIVPPIIGDMLPLLEKVVGPLGLFGFIGIAVGLFVFQGIRRKEYREIYRKECSLSIETAEYVRAQRRSFKTGYGLMSSFGICLCILSILNPIIIGNIPFISDNFGAAMFVLFIALGVFLITSANSRMNGYDRLLELNEAGKMSEEFVPKSDRKVNKTPIIICAIAAVAIAFFIGGVSVVRSILSSVLIKSDYVTETVSTTYDDIEGDANMELQTIKIDAAACEIVFETGEGEGLISADYTGPKKLKPEVTFENGKLTVNQNASSVRFNNFNFGNGPKLVIVVGKDVKLSSLEMTINAGNIKMNEITADYLFADIDAGNIEIRKCDFRKAEFDVDAGNFNITDSSFSILNISTDAGNIEISDTALSDVAIEVSFGSVDIKNFGDVDAYDFECEVDAGAINVDGNTSVGEYNARGTGAGSIKVEVDAGNIDIR